MPAALTPWTNGFSLADGETIVWLGGENMVRQQLSGILEARLLPAWGDRFPLFRSMAWEGDTVYNRNRDLNFGSLEDQLRFAGATSVWLQTGVMEAMDGIEAIPHYVAALSRILDRIQSVTPRIVLITPTPYEESVFPAGPDLLSMNSALEKYVAAIVSTAESRGLPVVDLFHPFHGSPGAGSGRMTHNGIHWNENGQLMVAGEVARQLGNLEVPFEALASRDLLLRLIREKNRFWFDCWRPMNWAFAYGDRTTQLFGQPFENGRWLKEELEDFKSLIRDRESLLRQVVQGEAVSYTEPEEVQAVSADDEPAQDPQEALEAMVVRDGFSVNLFASESLGVINPTQIAWDWQGRLFVACSPTYPHIVPGAAPEDYVLVCIDSDRDGVADHSYRYADGLHMVQGLEPVHGGLYVCAGTEIRFYRDADHDGIPEGHEVVLSGFGTGDAHQLVNSISHGPDGFIWMTQGLHILSHIETVHGVSTLERSGVWRFDPSTGRLDGYFNGGRAGHNCWGVAFDDNNQAFHKTGDRPVGYYMVPGWFPIANPAEYHPTGSLFQTALKTNSIDFLGSRHLPQSLQGQAVLGGFMKHTVELYRILGDGAGFRSEQQEDLLQSSSEDFRPVDVSAGPDGAIYICDFHNRLIGHYQTSYRDAGRDHTHGRVWRISNRHQSTGSGDVPVLRPDPDVLVRLLDSDERWVRSQSSMMLKYLNPSGVIRALDRHGDTLSGSGTEAVRRWGMHALGVYRYHQAQRPALVEIMAASSSVHHRAYAARMAGFMNMPQIVENMAADSHPRVRLEALVASVHIDTNRAFRVFTEVFNRPRDRFLDYALTNAARHFHSDWQPMLKSAPAVDRPEAVRFVLSQSGKTDEPVHPGKQVYEMLCLNCHQPDGRGLGGVYPPLAGNPAVTPAAAERLISILIHGLNGPLRVGDMKFNNVMPPSGLDNQRIADVLNYIFHEFGSGDPTVITESQVETVRRSHSGRTKLFHTSEF